MSESAVILVMSPDPQESSAIRLVLEFFGISARVVHVAEFLTEDLSPRATGGGIRLFCSASSMAKVIVECERDYTMRCLWGRRIHSAFVYQADQINDIQQVVGYCPRESQKSIIRIDSSRREWVVSDTRPDYSGPLSGLRVPVVDGAVGGGLGVAVLSNNGDVFVESAYEAVPVFLTTAAAIVDLSEEIPAGNFDIRRHFLAAAPVAMHVAWALTDSCWRAPEIGACLVIDDPLLWPRYGYLNYHQLFDAMEGHKFSTNIAFIPWNWQRSHQQVVDTLKENPANWSLSIHGCDHTGGEFGTSNVDTLTRKARLSMDRMARHKSRTGLAHDDVMVFPQGVFSAAAMEVLKRCQFSAAVNTEVVSTDHQHVPVTIADVWNIAVMRYGCFPLFTRRYPWQGIENFAFDMLLGKPCLVVIHHDALWDQGKELLKFIDGLNALPGTIKWKGLGEVVRTSCRQRARVTDAVEVEMYANELKLENHTNRPIRFVVAKHESDGSSVKHVRAGALEIPWRMEHGRLVCEVEVKPKETTTVKIAFLDHPNLGHGRESIKYKIKTMVRRYLSEFRDHYVAVKWAAVRPPKQNAGWSRTR